MGYDFFVGWGVIQLEFNWNSIGIQWQFNGKKRIVRAGNSVGMEVIQW